MRVFRRLFPAPAPAPALDLDALVRGLREAADDIAARRDTTLDLLLDGELLEVDLLTDYRSRIDAIDDIEADMTA